MSILQTTNYPNALLQNTFKNQFFQNVVNPAKLGTGPKPSLGTLVKNWGPFKAFSPQMLATGPTKGGLIGAAALAGLGGAYFGDWAYKNVEPVTEFGDWLGGGIYDYVNQTKFKQQQLMNIKKQKIKQKIREAEAIEESKRKAKDFGLEDLKGGPKGDVTTGPVTTAPASPGQMAKDRAAAKSRQAALQATRGGVGRDGPGPGSGGAPGTGMHRAHGGLIDFYRYGGFI